METSATEPNCSLISLDNSQETIENQSLNISQDTLCPEKLNINLENNNIENRSPDDQVLDKLQEMEQKPCHSVNNEIKKETAGQEPFFSSTLPCIPDVSNSLISDDEDEGNLADGSAAELPKTEVRKKKISIEKKKSVSESEKVSEKCSSNTENEAEVVSVRKSSVNSVLSRKQVSRHTAISRNQKHDKITSNIKRKPKHPANNSSTATSAAEPKRLPSEIPNKPQKPLETKKVPKIKPSFNTSTAVIPHTYSPPTRNNLITPKTHILTAKNSKYNKTPKLIKNINPSHSSKLASSTVNTSDTGASNCASKTYKTQLFKNTEARARREAQLNRPTRTASKHFQETHGIGKNTNSTLGPRKTSIVEAASTKLASASVNLRRKSYRPGTAPATTSARGTTGHSSREDSTTDVDRSTRKGNNSGKVETSVRPVSAATLKMRARNQQDQGQVHLQRTGTAGDVQIRRLARLSLAGTVGNAPSPKTKAVSSKIGSMANKNHIPGGGAVKIYDQSPNFKKSAQSKIKSLENQNHSPGGGKIKYETRKIDLKNVTGKVGSLQNRDHIAGGGNVKILDQKIKIKANSKIGSLENKTHSPGGGNVKILNKKIDLKHVTSKSGTLDNVNHRASIGNVKIFDQKLNFKKSAKSKVRSMDNAGHRPGGGDVLVYDEANVTTRKFLEASLVENVVENTVEGIVEDGIGSFEHGKGDF